MRRISKGLSGISGIFSGIWRVPSLVRRKSSRAREPDRITSRNNYNAAMSKTQEMQKNPVSLQTEQYRIFICFDNCLVKVVYCLVFNKLWECLLEAERAGALENRSDYRVLLSVWRLKEESY